MQTMIYRTKNKFIEKKFEDFFVFKLQGQLHSVISKLQKKNRLRSKIVKIQV